MGKNNGDPVVLGRHPNPVSELSASILNVDDNEAGRFAISQMLRRARFRVTEAGSGAAALRLAREGPDLIVLDVNLPDHDGFEVCRRLKADPVTASIPVLHLSGSFIQSADKVRGLEGGADGYLTKPVEPLELLANIRALLRIRKAEKALRESEQKLRLIADNTSEAIFAYDMNRRLTYGNPAVERLTGYTLAELRAREGLHWVHPADAPRMRQLWDKVFQGQAFSGEEFCLLTRQGQLRWCLSSWTPLYEDGRQVGVQGCERDITDRKLMELSLRDSEARNRTLVEHAPEAIVVFDADTGRFTDANENAVQLFGRERTELFQLSPVELSPPVQADGRPSHESAHEKIVEALAGGTPVFEWLHCHATGAVVPCEIRLVRLPAAGRNLVRGSITDISVRKRTEETLRESEARLRLLIDQMPAALWTVDTDLRITSSVGAGLAGLGLKPHQLVGLSLFEYFQTSDPAFLPIVQHRQAIQGDSLAFESTWKGRAFQTYMEPLRDAVGRITGCIGLAFDITERYQAAEALRASHRLLNAVIEGTSDLIYVKDREGRCLMVNSAVAQALGKPAAEILGKAPAELFTAENARAIQEEDRQVMESEQTKTYEQPMLVAGEARTFLTTKGPHRDDQGQVIGVVGISRDITERKRLEEQLRQAQKMEAIGRLAGGVAHDFNNLLTAIIGYSDLMLMDCPDRGHPLYHHAEEIKGAAERAASLTRQLLAYSRQQVLATQVLNLNTVVGDMEKLLRRLMGGHIELSAHLDPSLHPVSADPGQVEQVLMNLVVNARDAMPHGGTVTIETRDVELDEAYAGQHVEVQPGAYVRLSVSDTGCGLSQEVQAHLFEPFFTTKEVGKGTGLGLATIYGIIKQSGGHIEVHSVPGRGTTFHVFLPQVQEGAVQGRPDPAANRLPSGSETILLVEDEARIRNLARSMLERHGYTVLEASEGLEALEMCEQHAGPIHLVVTDMLMPRINGRDLFQQLAPQRPGLKVIYISGYPGDAIGQLGALDKGSMFLQKPFTPEVLVRKVRELLDQS